MHVKLNYQKADGKWYELVCYDYYVEDLEKDEELTSDNNDCTVTPTASQKSCRSCINLITCIQERPDVITRYQLCNDWERHYIA